MYVHTIQWLSLDSFPHLLPLHILHFTSLPSFLLQFFEELYYLLDNFVPAQSMSIRGFRWDLLDATLHTKPAQCRKGWGHFVVWNGSSGLVVLFQSATVHKCFVWRFINWLPKCLTKHFMSASVYEWNFSISFPSHSGLCSDCSSCVVLDHSIEWSSILKTELQQIASIAMSVAARWGTAMQ